VDINYQQMDKIWRGHRTSQHCTSVSEFGYLAAFSNVGDSKLRDVENDAKFRTF